MLDAGIHGGWNLERRWRESSHPLGGTDWHEKQPRTARSLLPCETLSAPGNGRQTHFGAATVQRRHCWERVRWIPCLLCLVPMDKWKGKSKGHDLNSDWERMQAAFLKMCGKNEGGKLRGKQANNRLLLTLVSMSVALLSPSSSTTFTARSYIVALTVSLVLSNDWYYCLMEQKHPEDLANNSFLCSLAENLEMKNDKESLTTQWHFIK